MWTIRGNLVCDTSTHEYPEQGTRERTINAARARGWHCHKEGDHETHLCPACIGTSRSKLPPAPPALAEDVPLF